MSESMILTLICLVPSMPMSVLDLAVFEHWSSVLGPFVLVWTTFEHGNSVLEPLVLGWATSEHRADVTHRGRADVTRRGRAGLAAATESVIVPRTGH